MTYDEITKAFDEHLKKSGCHYFSDIYVGITNNVERRLFDEHQVSRDGQWWVYANADNEKIARDIEEHYLDKGMRGGTGGGTGDGSATSVYCYSITPNTVE